VNTNQYLTVKKEENSTGKTASFTNIKQKHTKHDPFFWGLAYFG